MSAQSDPLRLHGARRGRSTPSPSQCASRERISSRPVLTMSGRGDVGDLTTRIGLESRPGVRAAGTPIGGYDAGLDTESQRAGGTTIRTRRKGHRDTHKSTEPIGTLAVPNCTDRIVESAHAVVMVPTAIATTPRFVPPFPQGNVTFPLPCPVCLASAGHPSRVGSAGLDQVEVCMRCRTCTHTWAYLRRCQSLRL